MSNSADTLRIDKNLARLLTVKAVPILMAEIELLQTPECWKIFSTNLKSVQTRLKIDAYVDLYENEYLIHYHLSLAFYGGREEGDKINAQLESQGYDAKLAFVNSMAENCIEDFDQLIDMSGQSEAEVQQFLTEFESLSESEKREKEKIFQYFWMSVFALMHQMLSVMVYGEKLTSLVAKAINGDAVAYRKAVRIDKNLLFSHNYFRDRFHNAQSNSEYDFLKRVGDSVALPPFGGKLEYPGFYLIFSLLESFNQLDSFKHEELLDMANEAGVHTTRADTEEVVTITKCLLSFRRFQKTNLVSMQ